MFERSSGRTKRILELESTMSVTRNRNVANPHLTAPRPTLSPSWKVRFDDDPKGGLVCELPKKGSVAQRGSQWRLRFAHSPGDTWESREQLALAEALQLVQGRTPVQPAPSQQKRDVTVTDWLEKSASVYVPIDVFAQADARIRRAVRSGKIATAWKLKVRADRNSGLVAAITGRVSVEQKGTTWLITTANGDQHTRVSRESCGILDALVRAQGIASVKAQNPGGITGQGRPANPSEATRPAFTPSQLEFPRGETEGEPVQQARDRLDPAWKLSYDARLPLGLVLVLNRGTYVDAEGRSWRGRLPDAISRDSMGSGDCSLLGALTTIQSTVSRTKRASAQGTLDPLLSDWLECDGRTRIPVRLLADGHDPVRRALRQGRLSSSWLLRLTSRHWRATVAEFGASHAAVQLDRDCYVIHLRKPIRAELHKGYTLLDAMILAQEAALAHYGTGAGEMESSQQPIALLDHRIRHAIADAKVAAAAAQVGTAAIAQATRKPAAQNETSDRSEARLSTVSADLEVAHYCAPLAPPNPLPTLRGTGRRHWHTKGYVKRGVLASSKSRRRRPPIAGA